MAFVRPIDDEHWAFGDPCEAPVTATKACSQPARWIATRGGRALCHDCAKALEAAHATEALALARGDVVAHV